MLVVSTVSSTIYGFLLPYVRHYRKLGWQIDGLAKGLLADVRISREFNQCYDATWSRGLRDLTTWGASIRQIEEVVQNGRYDIIHVHTPIASFVTRFALRNLRREVGSKVVYTAHGFHFHPRGSWWQNAIYRSVERLAGRWTDCLIVMNQIDFIAAQDFNIVPRDNLIHMPGIGLDLDEFSRCAFESEEIESLRASIGLKPGDFAVLVTAEFNPGKRHKDVIESLLHLNDSRVKILMAGIGATEARSKALARTLGVDDRILFLGFRRDMPALFAASQATLLPSEREGLPRSLMEAMASGLPAIGANVRGINDLLGEGCGLLVEVGDVRGYAEAIEQLLEDSELGDAIAARAKEKIKGYSIQVVIAMHDRLYEKLINKPLVDLLS